MITCFHDDDNNDDDDDSNIERFKINNNNCASIFFLFSYKFTVICIQLNALRRLPNYLSTDILDKNSKRIIGIEIMGYSFSHSCTIVI